MSSTNGPTLPPQAYTREMLSVAFQWLQNQPESIKRLAQTPDALVGLFMRAQRFGHSAPETDAPVSSQNFISDLKNLAEGLKQFEAPTRRTVPAAELRQPEHRPSEQKPTEPKLADVRSEPVMVTAPPISASKFAQASEPAIAAPIMAPLLKPNPAIATPSAAPTAPAPTVAAAPPILSSLNQTAQAMIQDVKSHLNLTSDTEVLNMMVALAYKNLKSMLA